MSDTASQDEPIGSIVVVAKCPIPGKSKTRLAPLLGSEGSAFLAKALLSDVLVTLSECSQLEKVQKCLLYAPANDEGLHVMTSILQSLNLPDWTLLPIKETDMLSSDVGTCMADALQRARDLHCEKGNEGGSVLFLGMDAPELPLEEIITALLHPSHAVMCPASDGGFAMLSIPEEAPSSVFDNVPWSQSLTAVSQLKALTDANVPVRLGRLMHDMDEAEDIKALAERLCKVRSGEIDDEVERTNDCLLQSSGMSRLPPTTGTSEHTWNTLIALGLVECTTTGEGKDSTKFRVRNDAFASKMKP